MLDTLFHETDLTVEAGRCQLATDLSNFERAPAFRRYGYLDAIYKNRVNDKGYEWELRTLESFEICACETEFCNAQDLVPHSTPDGNPGQGQGTVLCVSFAAHAFPRTVLPSSCVCLSISKFFLPDKISRIDCLTVARECVAPK
ncbi:hypothetical protein RvY_00055 [Ramazzottius varieornatus]|uniref:Uncharacterized protein n=1 Tax=Ramazzottius varieornatus TaxID=947166 RepID=A0A1D1ULD4_RAMVA|nr:hypothetical protein RvY_00055 [Ramazzottius varieornatus]